MYSFITLVQGLGLAYATGLNLYATVAMTGLAAEPRIEALALAQIVGVGLIGAAEREIDFRWRPGDAVRHQRDLVERSHHCGVGAQLSFFPLAADQQRREARNHDDYSHVSRCTQPQSSIQFGGM